MGSARVDRRVFLSHSSKDKGDIQRLAKALGERGIGVWGGVLELRLGQLCFENADDAAQGKLERRTERVDAAELGELLRERRVALFVLEACQTAMTAENPTASVAAALLASGVASVVAMSHAVYVETGRRFVAAFYGALAAGDRIGAAMVRAQHALEDDRARGAVGPGELVLSDWRVPVLFQEHADARLFPRGVDARSASVEDPAEAPRRGRLSLVAGSSPLRFPYSLTTALLFPQDRCPVSRQRRSPRKLQGSPSRPFPPRIKSRRQIPHHSGLESRPTSPS